MIRFALPLILVLALPAVARADPLPPGLEDAALLPPYRTEAGTWMTALRLELSPGWKTYWRSPGDSGVPPRFDWAGVTNLDHAGARWPRPEVIDSGGERTLGYHDALVLPIELAPAAPGQPVAGRVEVALGRVGASQLVVDGGSGGEHLGQPAVQAVTSRQADGLVQVGLGLLVGQPVPSAPRSRPESHDQSLGLAGVTG